ncbi:type III PLP-dependent enzyme [Defluviicoccus vanus]|uniref:ornithine decarboxylase n=1 Tax=Defluviicoccus vanus TaxID=111831 RepID=A0A7H1N2Q1_9PROT|nr:type III PLP-dependent enzyme [Defluviicoccus vanus]QNT69987.1 type III PLP-dependent enzyme [Defluviicoccus vanus]
MTRRIKKFLADRRPSTPCLVVDLDVVTAAYKKLERAIPEAKIYYAVKANPAPEILSLLAGLGSSFDCASLNEIKMVFDAGGKPEQISFGNTIKRASDIAAAFTLGVSLFAFDSREELAKIAAHAPGARVFCRILTSGTGAEWPLSRKFGCVPEMAEELLQQAAGMGVVPCGISFHVGSQQRDPRQWDAAVATAAGMFRRLEEAGIELTVLNIGGGFPARYRRKLPTLCAYGAAIRRSIRKHFGNRLPQLIVEPGRQMVGEAGIIETEVLLISRKAASDERRWVFLDIGRFGGLAETEGEAIQYPIKSKRRGRTERVILAGPTCDSADVLYERSKYRLPLDLNIGDKLHIRSAGAYTSTYASVAFNGFEPMRCYCI